MKHPAWDRANPFEGFDLPDSYEEFERLIFRRDRQDVRDSEYLRGAVSHCGAIGFEHFAEMVGAVYGLTSEQMESLAYDLENNDDEPLSDGDFADVDAWIEEQKRKQQTGV